MPTPTDLATSVIILIGIAIMVFAAYFMKRAHEQEATTWERVGFYFFLVGFFLAGAETCFTAKFFFEPQSIQWEAFRLMGTMCWCTLGIIGLIMANHISKKVEDMLL